MIKKIFLLFVTQSIAVVVYCQSLAINTTGATANTSAILDVAATNKGLLIPRVSLLSTSDVATITAPATGLLVYNTNASITGLGANGPGFYYYFGRWYKFLEYDNSGLAWVTTGNSNTVDGVNYIGTNDFVPLNFKSFNKKAGRIDVTNENVFFGSEAGGTNTAKFNTAIGHWALKLNTTGNYNTALGDGSLLNNTDGVKNTAIGYNSILLGSLGDENTAVGYSALYNGGIGNTAVGSLSLYAGGNNNTAVGYHTLMANTGGYNTAIGVGALLRNTTANYNVAIGSDCLSANTTGFKNTAIGGSALVANTMGSNNNSIGYSSLFNNTTGNFNTAIGIEALYTNNNDNNTAIGYQSLYKNFSGNNNIAIGPTALYKNISGNNNIGIGATALYENILGSENIGIGSSALNKNQNGNQNAVVGTLALSKNISGSSNTSLGYSTLLENIDGNNNTATGYKALNKFNTSGTGNTATGSNALVNIFSGNYVTALGANANASDGLTNATAIGANAKAEQSNSLILGSINGINGATSSTRVGIGTTTPNAPLQFGNDFANRKIVMNDLGNDDHEFTGFGVEANALRYQVALNVIDHVFYSGINSSSSKELLRITGNGNVGIGVPSPNYKLHIGPSSSGLRVEGPAAVGGIAISIGGLGDLQIDKPGTVGGRFIVKDNGNVGINNNNPVYKLDVNGDINATGQVRVNGIALTSDASFKQNISTIPNALSNLLQLRGTNYFFNTAVFPERNFSTDKQMGVIAQEVENIFPELVSTDKEGYKSVNYIGLIPLMIESIKTQQQQINELKQLVNKLINK